MSENMQDMDEFEKTLETITLFGEDGDEIVCYVLEETTLSGNNYLLVCEDDELESEAYILKAVEGDDDEIVYEAVEDDTEFDAVAKVFEELLEDTDFEY